MNNKSNNKVCFISSSGGHFSELKTLKPLASKYDSILIVEKTPNFYTDFCDKVYFISEINRKELLFLLHFFLIFIKEFFLFLREKPTTIITTGALCSYPISLIAKWFGREVIYVESYARVYDLSATGKKMLKLADKFYVQWPELAKKYPGTIFIGNLCGSAEI